MKPLKEFYPDGLNEDYNPLLESMGFEIVIKKDDERYDVDSYVLFSDSEKGYGCLIFGWGSSSGYDAMEDCKTFEDAEALRAEVYDSIRWGTASEMLTYFEIHDWEGDWSGSSETCEEFVQECIQFLKSKA